MIKRKILLIDNYDSFTYNLMQLIARNFNGEVVVKRNDEFDQAYIESNEFSAIVISPGPGKPADVDFTCKVIKEYYKILPILGICLGMQCINEIFEGKTVKASYPMHGKTAAIIHTGTGIFKDLPSPLKVARYHSLICEVKSADLFVTAVCEPEIPMAIQHRNYPLWAVQFHPESFLTEYGDKMIQNFLELL